MRRVILETPYAGNFVQRWLNRRYARKCLKDCLNRGEAPIASHLLYTQVLNDKIALERKKGIDAGLNWARFADYAVVYTDRGMSGGMVAAINHHIFHLLPIEYRSLKTRNGGYRYDTKSNAKKASPTGQEDGGYLDRLKNDPTGA